MSFTVEKSLLDDGVVQYTVSNAKGCRFSCLSYGCTLNSVFAPNKDGVSEEVSLCYPTLNDLKTKTGPYFGCVAGRVANRIKEGIFSIDGEEYHLAVNNGLNALHGGIEGFDKKNWNSSAFLNVEGAGVKFTYISADGEEGYPGELQIEVVYKLTEGNDIVMTYSANTSAATPINLTNHTYWNLSGGCSKNILDHRLLLSCQRYLPVTETQIPTGELTGFF